MIKTEQNTAAMGKRILRAAKDSVRFQAANKRRMCVDFEHGQWWLTDLATGAQWSVCDAEGGDSVDGFDFEQVTNGDED